MKTHLAAALAGIAVAGNLVSQPLRAADAAELPPQFQEIIAASEEVCANLDGGKFTIEWGAVERVDLDGDLVLDWVLNERRFTCSTAVSMYSGTGGGLSHFLINDHLSSMLNRGWEVVNTARYRVLLVDVHGSQCGGINPTPCLTASIWDREAMAWRSALAEWQ